MVRQEITSARRTTPVIAVVAAVVLAAVLLWRSEPEPDGADADHRTATVVTLNPLQRAEWAMHLHRDPRYRIDVADQAAGAKYRFDRSPLQWRAGHHFPLAALCLGDGTVTVRWAAPGAATGRLDVTCSDQDRPYLTDVVPAADGRYVYLTVQPDDAAVIAHATVLIDMDS